MPQIFKIGSYNGLFLLSVSNAAAQRFIPSPVSPGTFFFF